MEFYLLWGNIIQKLSALFTLTEEGRRRNPLTLCFEKGKDSDNLEVGNIYGENLGKIFEAKLLCVREIEQRLRVYFCLSADYNSI